ncbi:MAG: agmatine deiminase family protein [Phycisphaerae bacterium]|nr:agmatine deiminase family protein [Phycisphaerae bacterium]
MKRPLGIVVVVLGAATFAIPVTAAPPSQTPVETAYQEPQSLPKYMTAEERLIPFDKPTRADFEFRAPPTGTVHCSAEYEPGEGLLIAWEGYTDVLTDLTVGITTGDPEAIVYVVVDSSYEQGTASSTLNGAGADMTQVEFIVRETDTVWIRDYGPRFIFEDGARAIVDHTYNRPRPADNQFPGYLGSLWGETVYDIPLTHGGGNFHLFATGDAFMTDLILDENPGLSEQDVIDLYHDYQNVDLTIYPGFPTSFDSTQHIDMWMLPVADDEIIIGEYSSSTGQPYTITEDAVDDLEARGYTVHRTPGWNSGGTHYTYTNAVVLNNQVFIPWFGYASEDATALSVFETAFAGKSIIQIDCSSIIHAAGAVHCIVMHVPAIIPGLTVTPGDELDASGDLGGPFTPDSIIYTLENTTDDPMNYEVSNSEAWVSITNAGGTLPAHGTVQVTVSLNSAAESLTYGQYHDTVNFTNLTSHNGDTTRNVSLNVEAASPVITTTSLPDGHLNVSYGPVQLQVSGGQPPLSWSLIPQMDYSEMGMGDSYFTACGVARNWHADEAVWAYNLPFEFPFYGEPHSRVRVCANGWIDFGAHTGSFYNNSTSLLIDNKMIAPLWDDLRTDVGDKDIYIDESVPGKVTIRWDASIYGSGYSVNVAVTLVDNGDIEFHYGSENTHLTPTVGISSGDEEHYTLSAYNNDGTLTDAESMLLGAPRSLPDGMTLSSDGVLNGAPTESGLFNPRFKVTDALYRSDQKTISLLIHATAPADGDYDNDGDVDLLDFAEFQVCYAGPATGPCGEAFEFVIDGTIDLEDFAQLAPRFTGP